MFLKGALPALSYFTLAAAQESFQVANESDISAHVNEGKVVDWLKVYCYDDTDEITCNDEYLPIAKQCLEDAVDNENYNIEDFSNCMQDGIDASDPDALDPEFIYAETFGDIDAGNDPLLSQMLLQLNNLDMAYEKFKAQIGSDELMAVRSISSNPNPSPELQDEQKIDADYTDKMDGIKRFVELKQLTSFLQKYDKRISRYCFYGCWCLPEGAHSFVAGEGRPVDLVDKACQELWFCYTCAKQEFRGTFQGKYKECTPDKQRYKFKLTMDKSRPGKYEYRDIKCTDKWWIPMDSKAKWKSNCAKAICECDRGLAKKLGKWSLKWDKSRHRIWSQKVTTCNQLNDCYNMPKSTDEEKEDRRKCIKRGCLFVVKHRCLNGQTDNYAVDHAQMCCGSYENEGGRVEMRDHGGTHACCNQDEGAGSRKKSPWHGAWYNVITNCCADGKVYSAADPKC